MTESAHGNRGARRQVGRVWRALRSVRLRALLSLGIVLGFGSVGTLAAWTDDATASGATFSTGTLDLQLNGEADDDYAFTTLSMTNMVPGSSVAAMLPVQNQSVGARMTYTMTGSATNALGAALKIQIFRGGSVVAGTGTATCSSTTAVVAQTSLSNTANTPIITTAQGPVAAGAADALCFRIELPAAVANLQGATSTATFTFTATSVVP